MRTRIKICGLTRLEDLKAAVQFGADAIGLVFYPPSPRAISLEQAAALRAAIPPYVSCVALFVDPSEDAVEAVIRAVQPDCLQFHGHETPEFCAGFARPYMKALPVAEKFDLLHSAQCFSQAQGLLLDTPTALYGGSGQSFDWSRLSGQLSGRPLRDSPVPCVLSGGLRPDTVGEAIALLGPYAVDVSSGVESAKGIKDPAKIKAFIAAVRDADAALA